MLAAAGALSLTRFAPRFARAATPSVIAGAIRWDAWYSPFGSAAQAQHTLSFPPWQSRAPWFARTDPHGNFTAIGTQADMDIECQSAAAMGLAYWAFVMYAPASPLSAGWHLYQSSPRRRLVNWCAIIGPGFLGNDPFARADLWQAKDRLWAEYFTQPTYQRVEANRPLLYLLWSAPEIASYFAGQMPDLAQSIAYLRAQCATAGLGNPYIAIMAGHPAHAAAIAHEIGADAISAYIPDFGAHPVGAVPWRVLDSRTQAFWSTLAGQGIDCIPTAITGWDTRARRAHPESYALHHFDGIPPGYFVLPTAAQLHAHLQAAETFVQNHQAACPSRTLLIYSWDECDEGGNPLIPTLARPAPLTGLF